MCAVATAWKPTQAIGSRLRMHSYSHTVLHAKQETLKKLIRSVSWKRRSTKCVLPDWKRLAIEQLHAWPRLILPTIYRLYLKGDMSVHRLVSTAHRCWKQTKRVAIIQRPWPEKANFPLIGFLTRYSSCTASLIRLVLHGKAASLHVNLMTIVVWII